MGWLRTKGPGAKSQSGVQGKAPGRKLSTLPVCLRISRSWRQSPQKLNSFARLIASVSSFTHIEEFDAVLPQWPPCPQMKGVCLPVRRPILPLFMPLSAQYLKNLEDY